MIKFIDFLLTTKDSHYIYYSNNYCGLLLIFNLKKKSRNENL